MITTSTPLDLSVSTPRLDVPAGGEGNLRLTIHNRSPHVDRVWIEVDGAAPRWSVVQPDSLCLAPRSAGIAWLVVRPPDDALATATTRLAVRARSAVDGTFEIERPVTVTVAPPGEAA